jgi:hypothetical protein
VSGITSATWMARAILLVSYGDLDTMYALAQASRSGELVARVPSIG